MEKKILHWTNVELAPNVRVNVDIESQYGFSIYIGEQFDFSQSVFMMNEEMLDHLIFQLLSAKHEYGELLIENSKATSV